jgi:hypothetical protein
MAGGLPRDYFQTMNYKQYSFKSGKAGFVLNSLLLVALAGCVNYAEGQGLRVTVTPPVIVVAPPVVVAPSIAVVPDNYVYYPGYGVYYNTSRHQYAYLADGGWVFRPAPVGVSADVLLASPSVKMDFHDSPAKHHADMVKKYPKNYQAPRPDQKSAGHDDHDRK